MKFIMITLIKGETNEFRSKGDAKTINGATIERSYYSSRKLSKEKQNSVLQI